MYEKIAKIDGFLDEVSRIVSSTEIHRGLTLFISSDRPASHARPTIGSKRVGAEEISAVRARQIELGLSIAVEWLDDLHPNLEQTARACGLSIRACPLLVLTSDPKVTTDPCRARSDTSTATRLVEAHDERLSQVVAVRDVAFSSSRPRRGPLGLAARDRAASLITESSLERYNGWLASGRSILASTFDDNGPICVGGAQIVNGVAEIVGIGTLPIARQKGHASELTAFVATTLREMGVDVVFLSAASEEVARIYEGVGFERAGRVVRASQHRERYGDRRLGW